MDETTVGIIGTIVALGLLFGIAAFLQNRSQRKGNLFTGKPSMVGRVIAIIIGLALVGFTAYQFFALPEFTPVVGLVGVACLLYGFGANVWMKVIQGDRSGQGTDKTQSP